MLPYDSPESDSNDGVLEDLNESNFDDIGIFQEDALEYISGYIIRKLNLEEYECHENSYTWVDQVSKGSLKKPSNGFLNNIKLLESVFNKHDKSEICHDRFLRKRLIEKSRSIPIPVEYFLVFGNLIGGKE